MSSALALGSCADPVACGAARTRPRSGELACTSGLWPRVNGPDSTAEHWLDEASSGKLESIVPDAAKSSAGGERDASELVDELLDVARLAGAGESDAISALVAEVGGSMLRTVRKVLGPQHPDVEDVTQDAILALLRSLPTFRAECTVLHFARRVALLTALSALRRLHVRTQYERSEGADDAPADDGSSSPLARAISGRRRQLVVELLRRLPAPTAEAMALHFLLGHTVDEIAVLCDVPANTVWSRLRLGKQALRRAVSKDERLSELLSGRAP